MASPSRYSSKSGNTALPQSFPAEADSPQYEQAQTSKSSYESTSPAVKRFEGIEFLDVLPSGQLVARNHVKTSTVHDSRPKPEVFVAHPEAPEPTLEESKETKDTAKELAESLGLKAISFSEIKSTHYKDLGVNCSSSSLPRRLANVRIKGLVDKIDPESQKPSKSVDRNMDGKEKVVTEEPEAAEEKRGFTIHDVIEEFSTSKTVIRGIQQTSASSDDMPEAFAREIIDLFLAEMIRLLLKMGLGVFKAPELYIASGDEHVEISNGTFLTHLTGFVDYALFSKQELSQSTLIALRAFWDANKPEGPKTLLKNTRSEGIHILMIEAKKKKYSQSLHSCMPQVVAECIATMEISGVSAMRWCLSTGSSWLFGIIAREKWTGGEYRTYVIEPMEYTINELDNSAHVRVVEDIFWALICWSVVPVNKIIETVFKGVKPSGS